MNWLVFRMNHRCAAITDSNEASRPRAVRKQFGRTDRPNLMVVAGGVPMDQHAAGDLMRAAGKCVCGLNEDIALPHQHED